MQAASKSALGKIRLRNATSVVLVLWSSVVWWLNGTHLYVNVTRKRTRDLSDRSDHVLKRDHYFHSSIVPRVIGPFISRSVCPSYRTISRHMSRYWLFFPIAIGKNRRHYYDGLRIYRTYIAAARTSSRPIGYAWSQLLSFLVKPQIL